MKLPDDVEGLGSCEVCIKYFTKIFFVFFISFRLTYIIELSTFLIFYFILFYQYTMERGVVHACHAGGVVHALEGWEHNEVGAINVDHIDLVWEVALKHGLKPI